MHPFAVIDTHCDTLTRDASTSFSNDTLNRKDSVLNMHSFPEKVCWCQCFAIFTPECFRGNDAIDYYENNCLNFKRQMKKYNEKIMQCTSASEIEEAWERGKISAILTVENGSVLAGSIKRAEKLRLDGVRMLSLTWNAENEIGSGNETDHGLSDFGRRLVPELERLGIVIDVSHLNDNGFNDFISLASKPFVASHSNARSVCSHRRNLTDIQIEEMVKMNCFIGLNYSVGFIKDGGADVSEEDLYRHICRFLELGADKNIGLGSDFDGTDVPSFLATPEHVVRFADWLSSRGLSDELIDDIFWRNALQFFKQNL